MTTAKRQTLGRLPVLLAVRRADQGRPVRLLAAAAQPGAGRLRADRQAQGGRPGRSTSPTATSRSCNNPTFDGKNLSKNKLAEIAPQPAACDKAGEGPCGTDTGTNEPSTDDAGRADRHRSSARCADGRGGARDRRAPAPDDGAAPVVDPDTGEVGHRARRPGGRPTTTGRRPADFPAPTELAASRPADTSTFGWVAAVLLRRAGAAARHAGLDPAAPAVARGAP